MIEREGEGWRIAWDGDRQPFAVLIGGAGWATELSRAEAESLRDALADLLAQHAALVDQLMAEESISLELERDPWWLTIDGASSPRTPSAQAADSASPAETIPGDPHRSSATRDHAPAPG